MIYQFGRFALDAQRYVLTRDASPVEVEPQVFELLRHLVASGGRMVTKEELVEAVWQGRFVSDAAVVRAVQKARRALEDGGGEPRWIVAVYGRGYRFTPEIAIVQAPAGLVVRSAGRARIEADRDPAADSPHDVAARAPHDRHALPSTTRFSEAEAERLAGAEPVRPVVAVLPLANLSGRAEHAWIGAALAELLGAELAADGGARVVPSANVAALARDFLALLGTLPLDRRTLDAVRSLLGAELLVVGSFLAATGEHGETTRANLALRDAATGDTRVTLVEDGGVDLARLSTRLAAALRPAVGGRVEAVVESPARRLLPATRAATQSYVEGLGLLRAGDPSGARVRLEDAVAADPTFALGHAALAAALRELGLEARARVAAIQAQRLAATLPREHRLLVEGLHHECQRDWAQAAQSYTALWKFFPDDLEYGLLLVRAQVAANTLEAAGSTVDALRALPPPSRDDPRLDLAEADLAAARANPLRMRDLAALAARKAAARGARRLQAQAVLAEGRAWRVLGEFAKAVSSFRRAGELFAAVGDENGVAETVQRRGASLFHHGDRDEARALIADAGERYARLGRPGGVALCTLNLGIQCHERGEYGSAERHYEEALAAFREIGDRELELQCRVGLVALRYSQGAMETGIAVAREGIDVARAARDRRNEAELLIRMGECLYQLGRLAESAEAIEQALAGYRDAEDVLGQAAALNALGSVRNREGDLAESARLHLEALSRYRRQEQAYRIGDCLNRAANALQAQGKLETALELHRESLAVNERIGQRAGAAIARYGIATDLLGLGRVREAEPLFRSVRATFVEVGNPLYVAEASRGLAELEAARGDLAAAREALAVAAEHTRAHPAPELERDVRLLQARLDLEEGEPALAERDLRAFLTAPPAPLDRDDEAALRDLLAQALLEQGHVEEARGAVRRALALTERSQRHGMRLAVEITAARIAAATGDPVSAVADLIAVADRAAELGLVARRLESRLEAAVVRLRSGDEVRGRAALAELQRETEDLGFGLLTRRAVVLRPAWPRVGGG